MKSSGKAVMPGLIPADILVPESRFSLKKWAVIACDQYTSEPEYWEETARYVGSEPSALNLIFPEVYLGSNPEQRIKAINSSMQEYLDRGIFEQYDSSLFLVHRTTPSNPQGRWGMIGALDLEQYDYSPGSKSLVRATEGTILDRIPPRKAIRRHAPLELPHILVLIDDPELTVIEPLASEAHHLPIVYDTELMHNGGRVRAFRICDERQISAVAAALNRLADPDRFEAVHGTRDVLLYAMGDGNHSLATAKACWEDLKRNPDRQLSDNDLYRHPARYALVEIENIYDPGIVFEPIHRVLFNCIPDEVLAATASHCSAVERKRYEALDALIEDIETADYQCFGFAAEGQLELVTLHGPSSDIAAGTLQSVIDEYLSSHSETTVDYTHGSKVTCELGRKSGNCAIFLPSLSKTHFFPAIINNGALPRKTFSMGEAEEKRYYIEARRITLP